MVTDLQVSVVMSVFNGERYLCEALESILDQDFKAFEFIVINDGSTDTSGSVLDSYAKTDGRLRVYRHENKGLVESLNRGCEMARAPYIVRMDADDVSVKDRLSRQIEFMESHPDVAVLGGAIEVVDAHGRVLLTKRYPVDDQDIQSAFLRGQVEMCHPTVCFRREVFRLMGGYRMVAAEAEDYDLWLRMADRYRIANLPEVVLRYRIHPHQVSLRRRKQQTFAILAANAAALARRKGMTDPLSSIAQITPKVLTALGVSEARQQTALAREYLAWIRTLSRAGQPTVALGVALEMLNSSNWQYAERWAVADVRLVVGGLYWRQGKLLRSILSVGRALVTRPVLIGRPVKRFLRWLRPARALRPLNAQR